MRIDSRGLAPIVAALLALLALLTLLPALAGASSARAQSAPPGAPPGAAAPASSAVVPRSECFPVERLPAGERALAEELLLKMLDSEALYTLVGGLKPMSSGYVSLRVDTAAPDVDRPERTRRALSALRCGDAFVADLLMFRRVDGQKRRYLEGMVLYRPAFQRMVAQYGAFWAPWGVTPSTDPMAALVFAENDDTTARNRALGYLYGYPKPAVDFFVDSADAQNKGGKLVPRDFRQIPTFSAPTGQFVYAVPKGTPETEEDVRLRREAAAILEEYRKRRAQYIGPGKPGPARLLRDWFDDGTGRCAPSHARLPIREKDSGYREKKSVCFPRGGRKESALWKSNHRAT